MGEKIVKAYLCTGLRGRVRYVSPEESDDGVSEADNKTVVKLEPYVKPADCGRPSPDKKVGRFIVNLVRDPEPLACHGDECGFYNSKPDPVITALWDTLPGHDGVAAPFPEIKFYLPDHCAWALTELVCFGPDEIPGGKLLAFVTPADGGPIPEPIDSYSKEEAFPGGKWDRIQIIENLPVPGMKIIQRNYFNLKGSYFPQEAGHTYWCPTCIYGGVITEVSGDYTDPATTYKVKVLGDGGEHISTVKSSDFVEWAVGDWVYMIKKGGDVCGDQYRKEQDSLVSNCGGVTDASDFIIVPFQIGEFGA